ncbi:HIT domain-containing protein [uncultured Sphingomonas sp.]|uniref:HIT domain-containing protein n=1 Tax=uncultured Sphingomonas sp. TaxID=158754 RepID=UPI00258982D5|nr:HIT domain-containing protein [uncultured Sphingomonas sp.]
MSVDATQPYDDGNIFARLLRGEIPSRRVYEDEHVVVFHDIAPWAPTHLLAVPRGRYVSWDDFSANASDAEIAALTRAIGKVARDAGLVETGYRLIANAGRDSHQEVPHLHVHIMAGRPLGPMLVENDGRK